MNLQPLFLGRIGTTELLVILVLFLVFFGGRKIPELMRGLGRGVKEFKDAASKDYTDDTPGKEHKDDEPGEKA